MNKEYVIKKIREVASSDVDDERFIKELFFYLVEFFTEAD